MILDFKNPAPFIKAEIFPVGHEVWKSWTSEDVMAVKKSARWLGGEPTRIESFLALASPILHPKPAELVILSDGSIWEVWANSGPAKTRYTFTADCNAIHIELIQGNHAFYAEHLPRLT
jgi:hypothetical protein